MRSEIRQIRETHIILHGWIATASKEEVDDSFTSLPTKKQGMQWRIAVLAVELHVGYDPQQRQ